MQPSNEAVAAACQRAGIPVSDNLYGGIRINASEIDYWISPANDLCPGSALFIVAVLGALKDRLHHVGHFDDYWYVTWVQHQIDSMTQEAKGSTLTAACMAAIVAAYPEENKE